MATASAVPPHIISKQNQTFFRLLNELSGGDTLTLVIGAGTSVDAGLPSWSELVRALLEDGFKHEERRQFLEAGKTTYAELAKQIMESRQLMEAATIGRHLHGSGRDQAIRTALYGSLLGAPRPGRILRAVTSLCKLLGGRIRIVTTNYDDILEQEIAHRTNFLPKALVVDRDGNLVPSRKYPDGEIEVIHLHGLLPYEGEPEGALILDERDFAIEGVRPPGSVLPDVLDPKAPTLFLGLSMTDPNLVAACYLLDDRTKKGKKKEKPRPWFGLFVKRVAEDNTVGHFSAARLRDLGITPLHLVSYGQISQVLYELLHRVDLGADYWSDDEPRRYGMRFTAWHKRLLETSPGLFGGDRFPTTHGRLHDALSDALETMKSTAGPLSDPEHDEHFGVHLWVRRPASVDLGHLDLAAASAHRHREPWSLSEQSLPIRAGSTITAVDAIFYGGEQRKNSDPDPNRRWKSVIGVPIDLIKDPDRFLLSGVVTLSSTLPLANSVIRRNAAKVRRDLHSLGVSSLRSAD